MDQHCQSTLQIYTVLKMISLSGLKINDTFISALGESSYK